MDQLNYCRKGKKSKVRDFFNYALPNITILTILFVGLSVVIASV